MGAVCVDKIAGCMQRECATVAIWQQPVAQILDLRVCLLGIASAGMLANRFGRDGSSWMHTVVQTKELGRSCAQETLWYFVFM